MQRKNKDSCEVDKTISVGGWGGGGGGLNSAMYAIVNRHVESTLLLVLPIEHF